MKKNLLLFLIGIIGFTASSQTFSVSGTVKEAGTDMPLPNVNVVIDGTSKGTTTDFNGNYTLNGVEEGDKLVFSYIGFLDKTVTVQDQRVIDVAMKEDSESLDEVVLVGYGSQIKKKVTGAVSQVNSESIDELQPVNASQALQGTVAGVNVTPTSGSPGAANNIRIRGISTNGNSAPTIFLDGFQYNGSLNSINPNDIESITVLKDAQAAVYGTVGANGVILVETKSGSKNQKTTISYENYTGIQETSRKLPLLNAREYGLLLNESYANAGQEVPFNRLDTLGQGTDWQDEIFQKALIVNHNLSIRGGSDKINYSVSGSHLKQEGIISPEKSNFKRNTAALALEVDLFENLSFKTKLNYGFTRQKDINAFALGSVLFNAANIAPTISPDRYNLDGTINLGNEVVNPLAQLDNTFNDTRQERLSGTFQTTYDYAEDLQLQARIGFNNFNERNRDFTKDFYYGTSKIYNVPTSSVTLSKIYTGDYTFDLFHTYSTTFDEKHDLTFLVGMTAFRSYSEGLYGSRNDVQANSWNFADLSTATGTGTDQTNSSYAAENRRFSLFSRLQYSYDDKYLLSAMIRRDVSSRFGPNNRVAYFPSVTAGWVVSDESFMEDIDFLNLMKIRGSYGVLGSDNIGDFLYLSLLNGEATYVLDDDQELANGRALGAQPNPDLQWEESHKLDFGIDLSLLNNKLSFTADYYRNIRDNLLIPAIPVSGIYGTGAPGASSPTINAGEVENKGWEFALGYKEAINDDFDFSVNYNLTTIQNEVTRINGADFIPGGAFGVGQPFPARMETGHELGYFYGYQTNGIFQTQAEVDNHPSQVALGAAAKPGDIRYVDINNDGVINEDDRTDIGNPIPDFTMGLNLSFNYKDFSFSAYSYANVGNDIVRNFERNQPNVNRLNYRLERWTGPGTSNSVPRTTVDATSNNAFSKFFVEDGSFLRIQTVTLGYKIPERFTKKFNINRLRIYGKVDNLYTFTEYSGYDPTASTGAPIGSGIDLGFYPQPRTYTIGVNLQF